MLRRKFAYAHRRVAQRSIAEAVARTVFLAPFITWLVCVPLALMIKISLPCQTWWSTVVLVTAFCGTIYALIRVLGYTYTRSRWAYLPSDGTMCARCGYNLKGNVSGRCPECGEPVGVKAPDVQRDH